MSYMEKRSMNTKTCKTCGVDFPKTEEYFYYQNKKKGKFQTSCKPCYKARGKKRYQNNKEKILEQKREYDSRPEIKEKKREYDREYYQNNKEEILEQKRGYRSRPENKEKRKEYDREYKSRPEKKKRRNERLRERKKNDPAFRLRCNVSRAVHHYLLREGSAKDNATWDALPYTPDELRVHLETHPEWEDWMNWDNYGNGDGLWNIDHIIPQSLLLYDSLEHPNFLKCWALENLRPLCSIKNSSKGNRVDITISAC